MERKLIVTLLQKDIEELAMMTEGFMEMNEYPAVIIQLAQRKTEDVLDYIRQLGAIKKEETAGPKEMSVAVGDTARETADVAVEMEVFVPEDVQDDNEQTASAPVYEEEPDLLAEEEPADEQDEPQMPDTDEDAGGDNSTDSVTEEELVEVPEILEVEAEVANAVEVSMVETAETAEEEQRPPVQEKVRVAMTNTEKSVNNTIADAHSLKKIDDIRQAISIGDRFRFQRELFAGNGELLNKTLTKLNQMESYEEASSYLLATFRWNEEDETVESFLQIVKRKF